MNARRVLENALSQGRDLSQNMLAAIENQKQMLVAEKGYDS
jgi:hypothetical protein